MLNGNRRFENENFNEALKGYQYIVNNHPKNELYPRAFYNVGYIYFIQKKYDKSIPIFKEILESNFNEKENLGGGIMADPYTNYRHRASEILSEIYYDKKKYDTFMQKERDKKDDKKSYKKKTGFFFGTHKKNYAKGAVKLEQQRREKQRELFVTFINLAKELKLPLIIHARDAFDDAVRILEENNAKIVLMHMFGAHHLLKRVIQNGWYISMNAIVLRSKKHKKIIRDAPLERIMLETDSPWLSPVQLTQGIKTRNDPTSVKIVAQRIAEIKKIPVEEVAKITTENAINFFKLPIK